MNDANRIRSLFPNASDSFIAANGGAIATAVAVASDRPVPNAVAKRHEAPALGGSVQGKEKSVGRVTVRFVGYRVRPIDPDNFAASVKDSLDFLRHAQLIPGDEPWKIRLETEQEKVGTFAEERTEITIEYPVAP